MICCYCFDAYPLAFLRKPSHAYCLCWCSSYVAGPRFSSRVVRRVEIAFAFKPTNARAAKLNQCLKLASPGIASLRVWMASTRLNQGKSLSLVRILSTLATFRDIRNTKAVESPLKSKCQRLWNLWVEFVWFIHALAYFAWVLIFYFVLLNIVMAPVAVHPLSFAPILCVALDSCVPQVRLDKDGIYCRL